MGFDARRTPVQLVVLASFFVILGGIGAVAAAVLAIPEWRAGHGAGTSGTFTLTELNGCDRYEPPRQRCDWFGDFTSDDGTVTRHGMELSPELPPGATVGQTVRARDTGSLTQIYQEGDTEGWKMSALVGAGFLAAFVLGVVVLQPWRWRQRRAVAG